MDAVWFVVGADSNRLHIIFPWLGGNISMIFERLLQRSMGVELTPDQVAERIDGSYHANSGAAVTEETAWGQSTVYACVRILSESIAMLPIRLVRRQGGRTEEVENHAALDVLYNPNGWQTPHEYMQQWVSTTELRGNFNSLKTRNGRGQVVALLPLLAQQVSVEQRDDWSLVYQVSSGRETQGTYNQNEMLHARGMSSDGYRGMSTIGLHREAIGLALQTEKHGAVLFKNGAQMGKVFHTDGTLSDGAYDRLKRDINNKYEGVKNAHRSMILEEGLKVESIAMTNEDSQFLETRRFQKQEIAAICGVPMFLLNDTEKATTWGSGLEQISKAFVTSIGMKSPNI